MRGLLEAGDVVLRHRNGVDRVLRLGTSIYTPRDPGGVERGTWGIRRVTGRNQRDLAGLARLAGYASAVREN